MKVQLSFELLVYLALAFISVGAMLGIVSMWKSRFQYVDGEYGMYLLAQHINSAILSGNPNAYASLKGNPELCNQTFGEGYMETQYGNFSIIAQVNKTAMCG